MNTGIVASRYAKAFLSFAMEQKEMRQAYDEMQNLRSRVPLVVNFEADYLCNPHLTIEQILAALEVVAKVPNTELSGSTKRFFALLFENQRMDLLLQMANAFVQQYEQTQSFVKAEVSSAIPLTQEAQQRIRKFIMQKTGATAVELEMACDESLLAGFVLSYADQRIDASLSRQIAEMRRHLK